MESRFFARVLFVLTILTAYIAGNQIFYKDESTSVTNQLLLIILLMVSLFLFFRNSNRFKKNDLTLLIIFGISFLINISAHSRTYGLPAVLFMIMGLGLKQSPYVAVRLLEYIKKYIIVYPILFLITFGMFGGSFKVDITSKAASFVAPYLNPNMLIERFVIFFNVSFTYFIINYLKGKRGSIWLYMLSAAVSFYLILGIVSRNSILSIVIYVLLIVLYFVKGKNIFSTKSIDVSANKKQNVRVRKNVFIMLSVVVAIIAYNYIFLSIFQAKSISRNGETSIFDNSRLVIYKAVLTEAVSSVKVFFFGKGIGNSATQISGAYSDFDFFNRDADTFGAFNTVLGWQLELGVIFTVYFIYWLFKTCKNTPAPLYLKLLLLCTFIPGMFESLTFGNYSWFPELFKWVLISVIYNWDILPLKSRIKFVLS